MISLNKKAGLTITQIITLIIVAGLIVVFGFPVLRFIGENLPTFGTEKGRTLPELKDIVEEYKTQQQWQDIVEELKLYKEEFPEEIEKIEYLEEEGLIALSEIAKTAEANIKYYEGKPVAIGLGDYLSAESENCPALIQYYEQKEDLFYIFEKEDYDVSDPKIKAIFTGVYWCYSIYYLEYLHDPLLRYSGSERETKQEEYLSKSKKLEAYMDEAEVQAVLSSIVQHVGVART